MIAIRRTLLRAAPLAATGLLLPGCATTLASASRATPCIAPVNVAANRVIRTVAGLRPYRASGFVVRAEAVDGKHIVHNYGHGGAGITLSWGTSRLAVDLGLPGQSGPVAVIGSGVMGLTTARLAQEAGFAVTLYTAALPPDTTSNIAGGQWSPFGHYHDASVSPEWRIQFERALDYSWRRFQIMVGEDYGIRWLPTYASAGNDPPGGPLNRYHPNQRRLTAEEHPFADESMVRFDTMYVETGRFLRQLLADFRIAGGQVRITRFNDRSQLTRLSERIVFNCTGLGAHALFGDTELTPIRGQLAILLPQPEVQYAYTGRGGYMFPRPDGIVLGGTFERGEWDDTPQPDAIARIVRNLSGVFGNWACPA